MYQNSEKYSKSVYATNLNYYTDIVLEALLEAIAAKNSIGRKSFKQLITMSDV